jgi:hypothetical protein
MTHSQKLWWWGTAGGAIFDANVVMPGRRRVQAVGRANRLWEHAPDTIRK